MKQCRKYYVRFSYGHAEFGHYFSSLREVELYFSQYFCNTLTFFKMYDNSGVVCELHNFNYRYLLCFRKKGSIYFSKNINYV